MRNRYKISSFVLAIFFLVFLPHSNLLNQFDKAFSKRVVLEKGVVESASASDKVIGTQETANPIAKEQLLASLRNEFSQLQDFAVSIYDLNHGKAFGLNEDKVFPAASVMKLVSASALLKGVEDGDWKLSNSLGGTTVEDQLQQMINQSNNDSWDLINGLVGYPKEQKTVDNLGIVGIDVNKNELTSHGAEQLLLKFYKGEALTVSSRDKLFSYMQNTESENRISRGIPDNVSFYHKTGNFEGSVHDAALVIHPKNPFILVIFTRDDSGNFSDEARFELFKNSASKIYQYFDSI